MGIILYQIGIFIAIIISSFFGKSSRNIAVILISIFTILQVYTSSLMILQFVTIVFSFLISNKILKNNISNSRINNSNSNTNFNSEQKLSYDDNSPNIKYLIETESYFELAEILIKLENEEKFKEINNLEKSIKHKSFNLFYKVMEIKKDLSSRNFTV